MGDRTAIEVRVYSCPRDQVAAVLDIVEEYRLEGGPSGGPGRPVRSDHLVLGVGYIRDEISVGSSDDLASELPSTAAWKVWEDPIYQLPGQVHLHHPDLGRFVADCDAFGQPVFTSSQVDDLMAKADGDPIVLHHHTGATWELAFNQLDTVNNGVVLPRDLAASAPLQAVALNQLASGPARWLPPDAPGQTRAARGPGR
jgi:hypothetical protein